MGPIWCQITGMDKNSTTLGWRQAFKRPDGAYAPSTMKSYRVNVEKFVSWCNARGYEALPASVETVSEFLNGQSLNATTVKRVIKKAAGLSGFDESDVSDIWKPRSTLFGFNRCKVNFHKLAKAR